MAQNLGYLFGAFAVTWIGLYGFIFYIQRKLAEATNRMNDLERRLREGDGQ
jgi:CcmD family protein